NDGCSQKLSGQCEFSINFPETAKTLVEETDEGRPMRYLITGGSGYIGSRLVELLAAREDTERIVILDVRPPAVSWPKCAYVEMDIRDRRLHSLLEAEEPNAIVHLAFVLN